MMLTHDEVMDLIDAYDKSVDDLVTHVEELCAAYYDTGLLEGSLGQLR